MAKQEEIVVAPEHMTPEELKKKALAEKRRKNLIPLNERSPEERKAIQQKGGKAGHAAQQRNRTFREALNAILDDKAYTGNVTVEKVKRSNPNLTNRDAMAIAMVAQAIHKQDVKAFVAVRDTTGELPEQIVNVKNETPMTIRIETIGDDEEDSDE